MPAERTQGGKFGILHYKLQVSLLPSAYARTKTNQLFHWRNLIIRHAKNRGYFTIRQPIFLCRPEKRVLKGDPKSCTIWRRINKSVTPAMTQTHARSMRRKKKGAPKSSERAREANAAARARRIWSSFRRLALAGGVAGWGGAAQATPTR